MELTHKSDPQNFAKVELDDIIASEQFSLCPVPQFVHSVLSLSVSVFLVVRLN